jgi:hypothetical protein
VEIVTRELPSPSPLSHAILNARPYAFLDTGAEERRTVRTQPIPELQTAQDASAHWLRRRSHTSARTHGAPVPRRQAPVRAGEGALPERSQEHGAFFKMFALSNVWDGAQKLMATQEAVRPQAA